MRRHLKLWLNDAELAARGGVYEGIVTAVTEETVRNRYTAQHELQPVIAFDDGLRVIPNVGMRRALVEILGADTDAWIGRRITIVRRRVERKGGTVAWEKSVHVTDPYTRHAIGTAAPDAEHQLDADDIPWGTRPQ